MRYLINSCLLIFTYSFLLSVIKADPGVLKYEVNQSLMQLILHTNAKALTRSSQSQNTDCFNHYAPILDKNLDDYEQEYNGCIKTAQHSRCELDGSKKKDEISIEYSAQYGCKFFHTCQLHEHAMEFFECYQDAASRNVNIMYNISSNSTDILNEIHVEYKKIELAKQTCITKAGTNYSYKSYLTYEELKNCLNKETIAPRSSRVIDYQSNAISWIDVLDDPVCGPKPECKT